MRADPFLVRFGARDVAIRCNDPAVHQRLAALLGADPSSVQRRADYTVYAPARSTAGGPTALHRLYWRSVIMASGRDIDDVMAALGHHLAAYALQPARGTVLLDVATLIGPDGAILLPAKLRSVLGKQQRTLARHGLALHPAPVVRLDTATGELVVDQPPEAVAALTALRPGPEPGSRLPVVATATYAVDPVSRDSAMGLLAMLLKAARADSRIDAATVESVSELAARLPAPVPMARDLAAVLAAFGGAGAPALAAVAAR